MVIQKDPVLSLCFHNLTKRMQPNKAIIRIERKLLNRIYYVLKNERTYECGIIKWYYKDNIRESDRCLRLQQNCLLSKVCGSSHYKN